jgi:hypothetical protein
MTTPAPFYREPALLDSQAHRTLRLRPGFDFSLATSLHACFLGASEFPLACAEFPIVFVDTGDKDEAGRALMSPVALMGVTPGENLMVEAGAWTGHYVPAFIRRYPFFSALMDQERHGVFFDSAYSGFNEAEGDRLFDDEGKATEHLNTTVEFLQRFDEEIERTRRFCVRLAELDMFEAMTATVTLSNGEELSVNGFFTVKQEKMAELADAAVLEMNKNGMLQVLYAHFISLGMLRRLAERKSKRLAAEAQGAAPAAPAAAAQPQA